MSMTGKFFWTAVAAALTGWAYANWANQRVFLLLVFVVIGANFVALGHDALFGASTTPGTGVQTEDSDTLFNN